MHHSPVAILQNKRQQTYRASSSANANALSGSGSLGSGQHHLFGTSAGGTPSSISSSFIDHAFDHPTPTSFSQLQNFLSSSVASNGPDDYTGSGRVPKVEEKFCSGFNCCGMELDDLHHLLEHFEECHVLAGPPDPNNLPAPLAEAAVAAAAAQAAAQAGASNADSNDTPEFDDFGEEAASGMDKAVDSAQNAMQHQRGMSMNGTGNPTLSAPPSPALSSASDMHPAGHGTGTMFKRRTGTSNNSSFANLRKGKSHSPPSGEDDGVSMLSEDEHGSTHLPFTRRARQQSVDSVASVSTNASTASKKRSFNAAMGTTPSASSIAAARAGKVNGMGMDFSALRNTGVSTPDSSVPGTPASDYASQADVPMPGTGCVPPSLLFPANGRLSNHNTDDEYMTTDDEDADEDDAHSFVGGYSDFDDGADENDNASTSQTYNYGLLGDDSSRSHRSKRTKKGRGYDARTDNAAAAMFSPLSLLSQAQAQATADINAQNAGNGTLAIPTLGASTSPNSQANASAATLAAIQAAAASAGLTNASTPTGRIWVPNNAKPYKCPVPGCDKAYKQQNGLKYHRVHGHCNQNGDGKESVETEEEKPFGCYVGPACGKKYKNMNGLRYHYQHSGAHGAIGLQMLANGTHPPPAYPPGHKRGHTKNSQYSEFAPSGSPTVVMNQSTAEALLAAIGVNSPAPGSPAAASPAPASQSQPASRHTSRPATPAASRDASPATTRRSPTRVQASPATTTTTTTTYQGSGLAQELQESFGM